MYKKQRLIILAAIIGIMFFIIVVHTKSTGYLMNSGNHLLANGAYDQAALKFGKVVDSDPGNFEAQFNLAMAFLYQEQYLNAVRELKKAAYINPQSAEAWSNLAFTYEKLGLLLEDLWKKNNDESKRLEAIEFWNQWLFYSNDALQKENVRSRVEMLEGGESLPGNATPEELFKKAENRKDKGE